MIPDAKTSIYLSNADKHPGVLNHPRPGSAEQSIHVIKRVPPTRYYNRKAMHEQIRYGIQIQDPPNQDQLNCAYPDNKPALPYGATTAEQKQERHRAAIVSNNSSSDSRGCVYIGG